MLVACLGCGGGGDGGGGVIPPPIVASFTPSGTAATADRVRLTGTVSGDQVIVGVVLGGPTSSGDLYSFAFDLVLGDGSVAQYVDGSAVFGSALTLTSGQQAEALASQNGTRVTVGVSKLGGGGGNAVIAAEATVVTLRFRLLRVGSTTIALTGAPQSVPAALDSMGGTVTSVTFDAAPATLNGR